MNKSEKCPARTSWPSFMRLFLGYMFKDDYFLMCLFLSVHSQHMPCPMLSFCSMVSALSLFEIKKSNFFL